jgi:hypothetical protein
LISARVGRVNFSLRVEWLMDVTNVVDYQTESKRQLIGWVGESSSNLLVISSAFIIPSVGQHTGESFKGCDEVS